LTGPRTLHEIKPGFSSVGRHGHLVDLRNGQQTTFPVIKGRDPLVSAPDGTLPVLTGP